MTMAIKFFFALFFFMCILTVEVNNRTIFSHVYKVISPATTYVQNSVEGFFSKTISGTKNYTKKIFDNSVPKLKDSVDSNMSSRAKKGKEPLEKITREEKEELNQLIKTH